MRQHSTSSSLVRGLAPTLVKVETFSRPAPALQAFVNQLKMNYLQKKSYMLH